MFDEDRSLVVRETKSACRVLGEEIDAGRIWTMVFLAGWPVGGAAITVSLFAWQSKRSPIWIICSLLMTAIIATLYVIEFVRFANGATL